MSEISRARRIVPTPDPTKRQPERRRRRGRDKESNSDDESPFDGVEDVADISEADDDADTEAEPRENRRPARRTDEDGEQSIDVVA